MIDISKGRFWDLPLSLVDGCTPCSPGCLNCWLAAMAHRFVQRVGSVNAERMRGEPVITDADGRFNGMIITHPERLSVPLRRRKPTVYAVWSDLFHGAVPEEFIREVHWTAQRCGWHTFLVLTKRPERMVDFFSTRQDAPFLDNLFYGLTVCNQSEVDEKIPVFLQVPGRKFLSIEPILGKIIPQLVSRPWCEECKGTGFYGDNGPGIRGNNEYGACDCAKKRRIDAVILGGETGPGARPIHPDWVRSIRAQCAAAGVPFFFKQWGEWIPENQVPIGMADEYIKYPTVGKKFGDHFFKVGRTTAGRLLDGRTHDDLPWMTKVR